MVGIGGGHQLSLAWLPPQPATEFRPTNVARVRPSGRDRDAAVSVRTKSEGLPRYLFAGRAASSGSPSLSTVWTWIFEA